MDMKKVMRQQTESGGGSKKRGRRKEEEAGQIKVGIFRWGENVKCRGR